MLWRKETVWQVSGSYTTSVVSVAKSLLACNTFKQVYIYLTRCDEYGWFENNKKLFNIWQTKVKLYWMHEKYFKFKTYHLIGINKCHSASCTDILGWNSVSIATNSLPPQAFSWLSVGAEIGVEVTVVLTNSCKVIPSYYK